MKLGGKLAVAGACGILVAIAAAYAVSERVLAQLIINRIETATPLRATLGSARIGLWPGLRIIATGLTLTDKEAAGTPPVLRVDEANFGLSLGAFLGGRARLTDATLVHPVLRIVQKPSAEAAAPSTADGTLNAIRLTGPLTITDGTLIDDNQPRRIVARIEKIGLRVAPQADGGLALALVGEAGGVGLRIAGEIVSAADLAAGRATQFDGDVAIGAAKAQPRAVHTRLRLAPPVLTFEDLRADWTQDTKPMSLTAGGSFRWDGDAPKFTAHVEADALTLGAPGTLDLKIGGNAGDAAADQSIAFSQLRVIDAAIDVNVRDLAADGLHFGLTQLQTRLDDGDCVTSLTAPHFYRGKMDMHLTLDASKPIANEAMRASFKGLDSAAFLKDLTGDGNVAGDLNLDLDLTSSGSSPRRIADALAGRADVQFDNGVVTGIDLPHLFQTVTPYLPKAWRDLNDQITIKALTADFKLAHGQAATDDLHIVSPVLDVTGKGTIDLAARRFDLRFDPKVVAGTNSDIDKPASPLDLGAAILIRGPWSDPQITADLSGMMRNPQATLSKLKDLGEQFLGDKSQSDAIVKGLGDLLQGFGEGGASPPKAGKPESSESR